MTIIKVVTITGAMGWASHFVAASSLMRISLPQGLILQPSNNGLARNMQILQVFFLQDLQDLAHILQVLH